MIEKERILIGEYLIRKGLITQEQLQEVLQVSKRTNRRIEEALIKRGFVSEEDIARALSEQLGFIFVDLASYQIDEEAVKLIPKSVALKLEIIPIFKIEDSLTVAMSNPLDVASIDELSRLTGGLRIKPVISTPSGIREAIARYYPETERERVEVNKEGLIREEKEKEETHVIREAEEAPIIKLVNELIEEAVRSGASDIHLEPQKETFSCRFRIDGILHEIEPPPKESQPAIISRIKIMADMDIAQSRLPQDGRIQTNILGKDIDLRVATFPTIYGEHISIRILDKSQGIIRLEELGFQESTLKKFKEIIHKPYGMILVTGPTGSGKSTTLYAVLNTINDTKKNIITLEDPVEYTIPHISQSQVNIKAGLSFATGLRSIVRLDPDIIMIGEIRDRETADIAIRSALTGHLVFSTLHTNDAPSATTRLIDIGVEAYLVSSSLIGVLAQRLVRKLCPRCKKEYKPNQEEISLIQRITQREGVAILFKPTGCEDCRNIGYKGRTGIFELLLFNNEMRELIARKASAYELRVAAQKTGMRSLLQDGIEKVTQGITSLCEVLRVTEEV